MFETNVGVVGPFEYPDGITSMTSGQVSICFVSLLVRVSVGDQMLVW